MNGIRLFTWGSKMMTSGTPRPASFVKMSKKVGLFTTTPSVCRPGPLAVTLLESPACPSTLTMYGLFGISLPAKSTFTLCGPSVFGVYDTEYVRFLSLLNLISTLKMQLTSWRWWRWRVRHAYKEMRWRSFNLHRITHAYMYIEIIRNRQRDTQIAIASLRVHVLQRNYSR